MLLLVMVVFVVAIPLVLKGPDGTPVMNVSDWMPNTDRVIGLARQAAQKGQDFAQGSVGAQAGPESLASGKESATRADIDAAPSQLAANSGKMYKWQDEYGHWHFSSQKPADSQTASLEDLPDVENVMEAPVDKDSKGSMMGIPGLGDAGDVLEKFQRMAAKRDQ